MGRPATRRPGRRRRAPGWVPDQHGAWAMITVPPLVGIALSGPAWAHVPLLGLWWVGYLAFFAVGLWLRSRRRPRYLPAARTYALATVPLAAALLVTAPSLAVWALPYAPLVAVTLWCSARRKDRSLLNDAVTVTAAGLMTAVAYDAGTAGWWGAPGSAVGLPGTSPDGALTGWARTWLVTGLVTAYFLGTVLYVKTNIRERGNRTYLLASVAFHLAGAVATAALAVVGTVGAAHAVVWAALAVRAAAVPLVGARRGRPVRPLALGVGEIVFSVLVAVTLLAG
ncbi:YwiC-like protein [Georgenia soli]|uniref:YwiC-like protein n=1 Tax=Georgenia soli TaxID=638953 RepID=A0A2A9EP79_9MICO|nr:YwiC-like protein [Georgenia soli]